MARLFSVSEKSTKGSLEKGVCAVRTGAGEAISAVAMTLHFIAPRQLPLPAPGSPPPPLFWLKVFISSCLGPDHRSKIFIPNTLDTRYSKQTRYSLNTDAPDYVWGTL